MSPIRAIPPLSIEEARRILLRLEDALADSGAILIGGQAVALWTSYFAPLADGLDNDGVASKDIDFQGSRGLLERAADLLGGEMKLPSIDHATPIIGIVSFLDGSGHLRQIDLLDRPYGLRPDEVSDSAVPLEIATPNGASIHVSVMHPERCMESRVHNATLPNKQSDLAWRQLRASIACTRAFNTELVAAGHMRDVLKLNERIFRFAQRDQCSRLAAERDIEVFDAVLDDERLPDKFQTIRLPQMREHIRALRERRRAQQVPR